MYWINVQNTHTFTYQKTLLHTQFCLFLKAPKASSVFLISTYWEIRVFRTRRYVYSNLWEGSEYVSDFKYVRVLNIRKFSYIWQGSKYASGCNYGRVPSIPGFRVCQVFAYASVAQGFENGWIMFYGRLLNMSDQRFTVF